MGSAWRLMNTHQMHEMLDRIEIKLAKGKSKCIWQMTTLLFLPQLFSETCTQSNAKEREFMMENDLL